MSKTLVGAGLAGLLLIGGSAHASPYSAKELKRTMHAMNVPVSRESRASTSEAARLSLWRSNKDKKNGSVVLRGDAFAQLHAGLIKWRAVEAESESLSADRQLDRGHSSITSSKMGKQLNRISTMDDVRIDPTTRTITGRNADGLVRTAPVDGPIVTRRMGEPTSSRGWGEQSRHVTFTIGATRWPKAFQKAQFLYIADKMAKPGATFEFAKPGDTVVATTYNNKTRYEVRRFGQKVAEFAAVK